MRNKFFKKVFAVLAIAMMLATLLPMNAFAAGTANISVNSTDTHKYNVYQIFTGELSGGKLINLKWGQNATGPKGTDVEASLVESLEFLASETDALKVANLKTLVNFSSTPIAENIDKDNPATGLDDGYYLVKDAEELTGDDTYSMFVVQVGGNIVINRKASAPTVTKQVKENSTNAYGFGADAKGGEVVTFKLTGTVADNYGVYAAYYYDFADTFGSDFTYVNDSAVIKIDDVDVTDEFSIYESAGVMHFTCNDLKGITGTTVEYDSVIVVTYNATLGTNLATGKANPHKNIARLTFSNDPNDDGTHIGTSTNKEVNVYTYGLHIENVDNNGDPVPDAQFQLQKKEGGVYVPVSTKTGTSLDGNEYDWNDLDAGDYKIVEVDVTDGYNKIPDKEFTITSAIDTDGNLTGLTSDLADSTVDVPTGIVSVDLVSVSGAALPVTGAIGMVAIGAVALALGAYSIKMRKYSKEEE